MLGISEQLTGTTDALPDWRSDPTYQDALEYETEAQIKAEALDREYKRLYIDATGGTEIVRAVAPGHPVHAVQFQSCAADLVLKRATRAREQAEDSAKRARSEAGYAMGRDK